MTVNIENKNENGVSPAPYNEVMPRVDILEDKDNVVLLADMPGVDVQSAEVSVEDGVLTIAGVVKPHEGNGGQAVLRQERRADAYRRSFEMSDYVDAAAVKAAMKNGVLRVILPKQEAVKPRKIKIDVE